MRRYTEKIIHITVNPLSLLLHLDSQTSTLITFFYEKGSCAGYHCSTYWQCAYVAVNSIMYNNMGDVKISLIKPRRKN